MSLADIKTCLPSFEIIHSYSSDHIIFKCTIKDILLSASNNKIINWQYNRPPDSVRCYEIAEKIYTKTQEIDWLIYMVYDKDALHIIDGIHRIHSLQIIQKENNKPPDHLTPTKFGDSNNASWLYEKYLIISLRLNITTGQTIDLFQSLNKSNPVPDLYMFDRDQEKRIIIETIVNEWMTSFRSHFTSTQNPNIPNMNRDRFIDILDFVYKKYNVNHSNSHLLTEKLYELNTLIKKNPPKNITDKSLEKCNKTGCFIFLIRRDQLQYRI